MTKKTNKFEKKRYRGLTISIGLFITLIILILAINTYSSQLTAQNIVEIEISGKMRDDIQSVTRDLFDLRINYGESPFTPNISATIKRLKKNTTQLDYQLKSLYNDNTILHKHNLDGKEQEDTFEVYYSIDPTIIQSIETAIREWEPFKQKIDNYLDSIYDQHVSVTPLELAITQAQTSSVPLYEALDKMAQSISINAEQRSQKIGYIQISGIILAIIYFIIFIFFFVKRLRRSDIETEEARQETTEIMETIQEGLFLIDENLHIGQQTSDRLAAIVPGRVFSGEQMDVILQDIVEKKEVDNTRRFIKQLFNERIDEQLIEGLNPLQSVKIHVQQGEQFEPRYLRFIFTRVWKDDAIKRVLVSVTDITESIQLQQRLAKERKQNEQQMALLVKILHISPSLLNSFLRHARQLTQHINDILRRPERTTTDLKNKAREIFRNIHSFKGESAALGLDHFIDNCEAIEDRLTELQRRSNITGNDFMRVTIALDELIERINSIENLQANLQQVSKDKDSEESKAEEDIRQYYINFTHDIAERNNRTAQLNIEEYNFIGLDDETHDQLKEIIIQLIRNAVVHGIEPESIRQSLDKPSTGQLFLSLKDEGENYVLKFNDDGSGINYAALRDQLKQLDQYIHRPEQVDAFNEQELNRFIFTSGLSTAKQANSDAGRGVGMDVIKDRLHKLGGRIALRSQPEMGTQFVIRIPHSNL